MDANHHHELLILYASQTGTAKYVAENLQRSLVLREFRTKLLAMDEYSITDLPEEQFVIFIVATAGQGDPPSNMQSFWQFLLIKDLPRDALASLRFTVFGLGDSFYQNFNAMARKLYQRLLQLGATSFHERGLGDDQHTFGYDSELDPWTDALYLSLAPHFPTKTMTVSQEKLAQLPPSKYCISYINTNTATTDSVESQQLTQEIQTSLEQSWKSIPAPKECKQTSGMLINIAAISLLTPQDYSRKTIRVDFTTTSNEGNPSSTSESAPTGESLTYSPGDIVVVHPENPESLCAQLASLLKVDLNSIIAISKNPAITTSISFTNPYPEYLRVSDLFRRWLAISWYPTRYFFRVMSYFTSDPIHKEKLEELASNEGKEEYYNYVVKEKRNLYEILFDFNSVTLPLEYLLDAVALQKPREYSISSSCLTDPKAVAITVGIVEYKTPFSREIVGICSRYLLNAKQNEKVLIWIKRGTMNMPIAESEFNVPVIMVGPGTGLAPFMSFIEQRNVEIERKKIAVEAYKDKMYLLFGCRYKAKDFYYAETLEEFHELNRLNLFTAFSRDFDSKVYVQHLLTKNHQEFGKLIMDNFESVRIYVCGTAKFMPKSVEEAFVELLAKHLNCDEAQAKSLITCLIKKRQYIVEAW